MSKYVRRNSKGIYTVNLPCDGGDIRGIGVMCHNCPDKGDMQNGTCMLEPSGARVIALALEEWNQAIANGESVSSVDPRIERQLSLV